MKGIFRTTALVLVAILLTAASSQATLNKWLRLRGGPFGSVTVLQTTDPFNVLLAGSWNGPLMRSSDGGETWQVVLTQPALSVAGDPNSPGVAYAATQAGLYKSLDNGLNWAAVLGGETIKAWVVVNTGNPQILYGDNKRSMDGGLTWVTMTGLPAMSAPYGSAYPYSLSMPNVQVSMGNPNRLLAYSYMGDAYISNDAGSSWTFVPNLQRSDIYGVGLDPVDANYYYVAYCNNTQVFYPGGTYMDRTTSGDMYNVTVDPAQHNVVYVSGQSGYVFKSTNFGMSYVTYPSMPDEAPQGRLAMDADNGRLYAATSLGLYVAETRMTSPPPCLDVDLDGFYASSGCGTPVDCNDAIAGINPSITEYCSDSLDNDCNGQIDFADSYCIALCADTDGDGQLPTGSCGGTDCKNTDATIYLGAPEYCDGKDSNCDGIEDPSCPLYTVYYDYDRDGYGANGSYAYQVYVIPAPGYSSVMGDCDDYNASVYPGAPEICSDLLDNDCNSKIDCGDQACNGDPVCAPPPEICNDGIDNDGDRKIDCRDSDCLSDPACAPKVEICNDGIDNDGDRKIDCADSDCLGNPACVPKVEICTDGIDNDGDRKIDCADSDCLGNPACAPKVEICNDGIDNDGDRKIDCVDRDCLSDPYCKK